MPSLRPPSRALALHRAVKKKIKKNVNKIYVCWTLAFNSLFYLLYLLTAALCADAAPDALHLTCCRVACFPLRYLRAYCTALLSY
jgi:hypothetical protein